MDMTVDIRDDLCRILAAVVVAQRTACALMLGGSITAVDSDRYRAAAHICVQNSLNVVHGIIISAREIQRKVGKNDDLPGGRV